MQTSTIFSPSPSTKTAMPSSSSMKKLSIKTATTVTTATTPTSASSTNGNTSPSTGSASSTIKKQKQRTHPRKQKATVRFKNLASTNGIKSIVGLSWLLPLICAMCIPLIHNIIGYGPIEWWLQIDSLDFIIFVIIQILFVFLFVLLFVTLMKKLIFLTKKYEKFINSMRKRCVDLYISI